MKHHPRTTTIRFLKLCSALLLFSLGLVFPTHILPFLGRGNLRPQNLPQSMDSATDFCQSPTLQPYTLNYLTDVEERVARFMIELPEKVFNEVSKFNLPGPKGKDIWAELRELRDPGCLPIGVKDQFGTNDRHSFALWKPHIDCVDAINQAFGGMDGENSSARQLCSFSKALQHRVGCVVYSFGVNSPADMGFEEAILLSTKCKVFSFDCTMGDDWSEKKELVAGRHVFYPYCISAKDNFPDKRYFTLPTITKMLGHAPPTFFKMDIEAFEHAVIHSWRNSDPLPEQFNMELHCTTEPISGSYRELSNAEQTFTLMHLYRLGYRVARTSREEGGIDTTLIRVKCEKGSRASG